MPGVERPRAIRHGMSEEQRRAASDRMRAMRAAQTARAKAAAVVEAPIPAAVANPPASPPPPAVPQAEREIQATPERMQRLKQLWMNPSLTLRDLLAEMNALPGPQLSHSTGLYRWAGRLGLPTTRPARPDAPPPTTAEVASEPPPLEAPPEPASQPAPLPPPLPTPPAARAAAAPAAPRRPLRPDDVWDEARSMLRAGIPVITVAEETGLTTGQVRDLKFGMSSTGKAKEAV